jgi:hypothetical protein
VNGLRMQCCEGGMFLDLSTVCCSVLLCYYCVQSGMLYAHGAPRRYGLRDIATLLNPRNEGVRNGMRFRGLAPSARFCANKAHSVTHIHIIIYVFVQFSRAKPSVYITN